VASGYTSEDSGRLGRPDVEVWTFRYTCRLEVSDKAEDGMVQKLNMGR
jgi:hypothetical protein